MVICGMCVVYVCMWCVMCVCVCMCDVCIVWYVWCVCMCVPLWGEIFVSDNVLSLEAIFH